MHAVQEMLLQSWSPTLGKHDTEIIRLFPATPWRWHNASFADLRAEGGHRVSARRENNVTTWFRITAGRNGLLQLNDNFGNREPCWMQGKLVKHGDLYQSSVRQGEVIEACFDKPKAIPAAPPDVARPVEIAR